MKKWRPRSLCNPKTWTYRNMLIDYEHAQHTFRVEGKEIDSCLLMPDNISCLLLLPLDPRSGEQRFWECEITFSGELQGFLGEQIKAQLWQMRKGMTPGMTLRLLIGKVAYEKSLLWGIQLSQHEFQRSQRHQYRRIQVLSSLSTWKDDKYRRNNASGP